MEYLQVKIYSKALPYTGVCRGRGGDLGFPFLPPSPPPEKNIFFISF